MTKEQILRELAYMRKFIKSLNAFTDIPKDTINSIFNQLESKYPEVQKKAADVISDMFHKQEFFGLSTVWSSKGERYLKMINKCSVEIRKKIYIAAEEHFYIKQIQAFSVFEGEDLEQVLASFHHKFDDDIWFAILDQKDKDFANKLMLKFAPKYKMSDNVLEHLFVVWGIDRVAILKACNSEQSLEHIQKLMLNTMEPKDIKDIVIHGYSEKNHDFLSSSILNIILDAANQEGANFFLLCASFQYIGDEDFLERIGTKYPEKKDDIYRVASNFEKEYGKTTFIKGSKY